MEDTHTHKALARKYRPSRFNEVFHQASIVETMKNALASSRLSHAYLFSGTRGTGKTSLARLFAKAINCTNRDENQEPCNQCPACQEMIKGGGLDFLEMDGASNRGIDDIRSLLETVAYKPSIFSKKIYLIDEVHMLTKEAFNALLKTLEEPPAHVIFFLATTERHKLPATIISRCQRFELGKIPPATIVKKLRLILQDFSTKADDAALELIATHSEGALRDAESILDQMLCLHPDHLTKEGVQQALGLPEENLFFQIDEAISQDNLAFPFTLVETLHAQGLHLSYFLSSLATHYRTLCTHALTANKMAPPTGRPTNLDEAISLYDKDHLFDCLERVTKKLATFTDTTLTPMDIEVLVLELIRSKGVKNHTYLVQQLLLLKKAVLGTPDRPPIAYEQTPSHVVEKPVPPSPSPEPAPIVATKKPAPLKTETPPPATPSELAPVKKAEPVQKVALMPPPKTALPQAPTPTGVKKVLQDQTLWFAAVELGGNLSKE